MTELILTNRAVLDKENFPSVLLKKTGVSIDPENLMVVAPIQSSVNIDIEEIYQSVKMEVKDDSEARELTALKLGRIFTNLMFDIRRRKNMLSLQKSGVLKRIEDVKTKLVKIYSFEKAYSYIGQIGRAHV